MTNSAVDSVEVSSRQFRSIALAVGATTISIAIGWMAANGRLVFVAPLVGVGIMAIFRTRPWVAMGAILGSTSTFVAAGATPRLSHFYLPELLLGLALASLLYVRPARMLGGFDGALVAAMLFADTLGVAVGGLTHDGVVSARFVFLYATFWIALAAWRVAPSKLFIVLATLGIVVSLASVAESLSPGLALFRADALTLQSGVARVRAPGLFAAYFSLIFAVSYLLFGLRRHRGVAIAIGALSAAAVTVSLNRNMILGAILGLLTSTAFARGRQRAATAIAISAVAAVMLFPYVSASPFIQRVVSLDNYAVLKQSTLSDRYYEDARAWHTIKRHPLLGIGWGTSYGATISQPDGSVVARFFIHNQYFGLWLRMGLLGLTAFLFLLARSLRSGIVLLRAADRDAWLGGGVVAAVVAFAASSAVGTYVFDAGSVPIVAALFALATTLSSRSDRPAGEIVS